MNDAGPVVKPSDPSTASVDAAASALATTSDDLAARRTALRDLAAMIGQEVFY